MPQLSHSLWLSSVWPVENCSYWSPRHSCATGEPATWGGPVEMSCSSRWAAQVAHLQSWELNKVVVVGSHEALGWFVTQLKANQYSRCCQFSKGIVPICILISSSYQFLLRYFFFSTWYCHLIFFSYKTSPFFFFFLISYSWECLVTLHCVVFLNMCFPDDW